jgi:glyoxylase-like metal-dependent hydrolase (beta-lactamase superfamily II)
MSFWYEWPATLRALEALDFDRVIPGHGSVQEGKSVLAEFRGYVEEVTEKVTRGVERGQPPGRAPEDDHPRCPRLARGEQHTSTGGARVGVLFTPPKPGELLDGGVSSNGREVFTYLLERKGKRELPLR